jgi:HEPN domain-containing protein
MKQKQDYIKFWIEQAEGDWNAVDSLYKGRNYLQSLFFAHLVLEKLCKALWIKYSEENIPPKTHNLNHLLSTTPVQLADKHSVILLNLNRFQIEGRYPDYLNKLYSICNKEFTHNMLEDVNQLRLWLIEKLQ